MTREMFLTSVLPIGARCVRWRTAKHGGLSFCAAPASTGALFSGTLWFGNASYTYLSVSFIQMLKALMPAAVYACSCAWVRPSLFKPLSLENARVAH